MVDQSMLTGESVRSMQNPGSQVYAAALVRRGQAVAEVTATGTKTYFGRTAELVRLAHAGSTEQAGNSGVTRTLAIINGAVAVLYCGLCLSHRVCRPPDLIRLALTALLATIPVALAATFTVSAALGAQVLARRGVLLTRLSAAHEAAAMDVLCADKTGTLTPQCAEGGGCRGGAGIRPRARAGACSVGEFRGGPGPDRRCHSAQPLQSRSMRPTERLVRFVPFDPATKSAEAFVIGQDGDRAARRQGGIRSDLARRRNCPANARSLVDSLRRAGRSCDCRRLRPHECAAPRRTHRASAIRRAGDSAELIGTLARAGRPHGDGDREIQR